MRYDRTGAAAVIAAARRQGLTTRISPWGVGGLFGGEGIAEFGREPRETLAWWLTCAHELQPDAMFWDEPHGEPGLRVMIEAMTSMVIPGGAQYLYINPERSAWRTKLGMTMPYCPVCLGPTVLKRRTMMTGSFFSFQ